MIDKLLKKYRKPFDKQVYAIPYAGDMFEVLGRAMLKEYKSKKVAPLKNKQYNQSMKINTQIKLKDLSGKELPGENTFGQFLANILIQSKTGGKMKMYTLATKLYNDKSVEVDASDLSLIKESIKTTEVYTGLVSGQCELLLEDIKEINIVENQFGIVIGVIEK